jgi:hypothetical protein
MTPRHEEQWYGKPSVPRFSFLRVLRSAKPQDLVILARQTERRQENGAEKNERIRKKGAVRRAAPSPPSWGRSDGQVTPEPSESCETNPIPGGAGWDEAWGTWGVGAVAPNKANSQRAGLHRALPGWGGAHSCETNPIHLRCDGAWGTEAVASSLNPRPSGLSRGEIAPGWRASALPREDFDGRENLFRPSPLISGAADRDRANRASRIALFGTAISCADSGPS